MTAHQVSMLQVAIAILTLIFCSYLGGRVHQWYRQSMERDAAFREGYNHASESLFPLAARSMQQTTPPLTNERFTGRPQSSAAADQIPATRQFAPHPGRHTAHNS